MAKRTCGDRARTEKVAVIISQCESPLSDGINMDTLVGALKRNPVIGLVRVQAYPSTRGEIERIASEIAKRGFSRIVVAGSSERLFGRLYRESLAGAGVDPAMVEFANIREHCLLTHKGSKKDATSSAVKLVNVAAARVTHAQAMSKLEADIKPLCVVVGGGISGISAALALTTRGVKVTLVDKEARIGGLLNRLNAVFPAYVPAQEFLNQQAGHLEEVGIEVIAGTEPVSVSGHVGQYEIGLSNGVRLEAGAIIVATGADLLSPEGIFGYGEVDGVITQLDLEGMLLRAEDPGSNIVMIQCAGSRNEERPYCSRVCCTASIKNTILVKERHPRAKITILSRGFSEYAGDLDRAREMGVEIIRYSPERPPVVGQGAVEVYDEISDMETRIPFDRVILAVPMVPSQSTRALAEMLKMPTDQYGFLVETRLKVRPEEFAPRGIFVAGCAHWPSTMNEAILQGYGAASRAYDLISEGKVERTSYVAAVDKDFCRGCARCEEACQHGAIALETDEDGMKRAEVIEIHCTGCGVCTSVCPSGAIGLPDMSSEQMDKAIEAMGRR
jgi:heterodisulfide reductase subunit A